MADRDTISIASVYFVSREAAVVLPGEQEAGAPLPAPAPHTIARLHV